MENRLVQKLNFLYQKGNYNTEEFANLLVNDKDMALMMAGYILGLSDRKIFDKEFEAELAREAH